MDRLALPRPWSPSPSTRRAVLAGALGLALGLALATASSSAWAGSYLDRSQLLIAGAERDRLMLRARLTDKELATVVLTVAEARVNAATKMQVPTAVAKAHPHLLLALTNVERAARAALDGNFKSAVVHLEGVSRERTLFIASLKEAGHPLPGAE